MSEYVDIKEFLKKEDIKVRIQHNIKGGLKESFHFNLNSKNGCQITTLITIHQKKEGAQDGDLAPIHGDLNQSEKLSEIKPSLTIDYLC